MHKLLIIGGSGLLGLNWALRKRCEFETCITLHNKIIHLNGVNTVSVDTSNADKLSAMIDTIKPDLVVNTAGLTNVEHCERQPNCHLNRILTQQVVAITTAALDISNHVSTDHFLSAMPRSQMSQHRLVP